VEEAKTHVTDDPLALLTKEDLAVTVSQLLLPTETVLKAIKRYAKKDKALSEQERTANKAAFEVSCTHMQGKLLSVRVSYHVVYTTYSMQEHRNIIMRYNGCRTPQCIHIARLLHGIVAQ
jgi:hypothetical protein